MRSVSIFIALLVVSCCIASAQSSPTASSRVPTPAQINGTYKSGRNEFRILALGQNKLKVQFYGEWMTRSGYPNIGETIGETTIHGDVAILIPANSAGCKITLSFFTNRLKVDQEGLDADCGFGHNVVARGVYRRVKSGRPKFLPIPR